MGSQLQLCIPVGSHLIFKMHKVLVATQLAQSMSPDLLRVLENVALMLSQDTLVLGMGMVMDLEELALELVSTHLVQFMSPDLLRVLESAALMLSQDTLVLGMVMDLEELALELVSTHLDPFMSPD